MPSVDRAIHERGEYVEDLENDELLTLVYALLDEAEVGRRCMNELTTLRAALRTLLNTDEGEF